MKTVVIMMKTCQDNHLYLKNHANFISEIVNINRVAEL